MKGETAMGGEGLVLLGIIAFGLLIVAMIGALVAYEIQKTRVADIEMHNELIRTLLYLFDENYEGEGVHPCDDCEYRKKAEEITQQKEEVSQND